MTSELAENGYYVRTYDRDVFLTEGQKTVLYQAMDMGKTYFDLDGNRIMMNQIKEVIKSADYKKSVTGGYYCPKHPKNFVSKGKTCGYC